jgi:hypothetical protein
VPTALRRDPARVYGYGANWSGFIFLALGLHERDVALNPVTRELLWVNGFNHCAGDWA